MAYALPIAYALFLWWFATGLIFFLDQICNVLERHSIILVGVHSRPQMKKPAKCGRKKTRSVAGVYRCEANQVPKSLRMPRFSSNCESWAVASFPVSM